MSLLLLAAAISCLTPQHERLTLARQVPYESAQELGLPDAQWYWLALEGERILWPRSQTLSFVTSGGRVVRARFLLLKSPDLTSVLVLGQGSVDVPASDFARKRSKDGRLGTVIFAGFSAPVDSIVEIRVGSSLTR